MSAATRVTAGVLALAAAGGAAWALLPADRDPDTPSAGAAVPLSTATVERRDLVEREDVGGTLGFAGARTVAAGADGTITRLCGEGAVVRRGRSLLSIDARATAWVLYGTRPMYRDLGPGATDGSDVRQLERNLAALGYDPGTVDADWTAATTAAVAAFQEDRGLDATGTLRRADVVVSDGPLRVGAHKAQRGDTVRAGAPVTAISTTRPEVSADVGATLAADVRRGDRVDVTLPDGHVVHGAVTQVGSVATPAGDGAEPTVELRARLDGARRARLDGAPVTLSVATAETKAALAVPVTALVTTGPSAYAVQLAGSRRLVPVTLGASADGWAQVEGDGLRPGTRVVVPA
jgi:peptidoglycan hydrolase-like protein with peptidoglycan-binding domain